MIEFFTRLGAVHRSEIKNYPEELGDFLKMGLVEKIRRKKEVYYQLTPKALPLLDDYRQHLLYKARLQSKLHPKSQFYRSLVDDLRFLKENDPKAQDYLFLGDWQLNRPPTQTQLELSQLRYFESLQRS